MSSVDLQQIADLSHEHHSTVSAPRLLLGVETQQVGQVIVGVFQSVQFGIYASLDPQGIEIDGVLDEGGDLHKVCPMFIVHILFHLGRQPTFGKETVQSEHCLQCLQQSPPFIFLAVDTAQMLKNIIQSVQTSKQFSILLALSHLPPHPLNQLLSLFKNCTLIGRIEENAPKEFLGSE